ncbi:MAG TPA: SIS domain-containing protein [Candidatus Polarisedimenticolia bacterium]|nr:SIS domain-containing protein [Candidatus Polarisedimenticolia bacterium]
MSSETPRTKDRTRHEREVEEIVRRGYERHRAALQRLGEGPALERLRRLALLAHEVLARGGKVLACGNGGSASDAQHFAAELVGRYKDERPALAAVALTSDGAVLTCLANDYDYERIFARQVEALGRPGDLLLAISTSGRSPNVLRALETARARGLSTAALLGRDGGPALPLADVAVVVEDEETARIQEGHALLIHLLCEALDHLPRPGNAPPR